MRALRTFHSINVEKKTHREKDMRTNHEHMKKIVVLLLW